MAQEQPSRRIQLQTLLESLAGKVYFQPPPSLQMEYPCIVYQKDNLDTKFANNVPYGTAQRYQVTVIDEDPDSDIPAKIATLPKCSFRRFFIADGLNHDVYTLYF